MKLTELQHNWNRFGNEDPMWAILTDPDKRGNKWAEDDFFASGQEHVGGELDFIRERYPQLTMGKALDFGCGLGRLSQGLAAHFERVDGVDIAPSMIDGAKELNRFSDTCRYHVNNADDLSLFGDDEFDFVMSFITLQHMQPKYAKNYVAEFLRVLKPGGYMTFQIPSIPDEKTRKHHSPLGKAKYAAYRILRSEKYHRDPIMEMHWVAMEQMVRLLRSQGGEVDVILRDNSAGAAWTSYAYYVTKRG